ncbi:MAG: sterol desaturase family protein [Porticoccaceae bacterium]
MTADEFILTHEISIRLGAFLGAFALVAVWEVLAPRREPLLSRARRWPHNLGLMILNTLTLRLLFPVATVGVAAFVNQRDWGILNYLNPPAAMAVLISLIALDLIIYCQHVLFHAVPALWRLHRVHHADLDYDLTTGIRFHPLEIMLSMLIKFASIAALGPSVAAVVIFEVALNATSLFNHGNLRLPARLDCALRWLVVTPDMHRVHHSVADDEANSNFGFNLPWWDRWLGTYRDQPRGGHQRMMIGIHDHRDPAQVARLTGMLALPFIGDVTRYAINRSTRHDDNTEKR